MAKGIIEVSELKDPIGEIVENFIRPNGLHIDKVAVPMGVIGIIYESRPNVTADAFASVSNPVMPVSCGEVPMRLIQIRL